MEMIWKVADGIVLGKGVWNALAKMLPRVFLARAGQGGIGKVSGKRRGPNGGKKAIFSQ